MTIVYYLINLPTYFSIDPEFKDIAQDTIKEITEKVWPKTRKELENALEITKGMIDKGEKYLKNVSEKGAQQTKKLSLSLNREKLYYDLGKLVSRTPKTKWKSNQKIRSSVKIIKDLTKDIKKIK